MNLNDVRDELVTAIDVIDGLRVYAWVKNAVSPPAALVMLPTDLTFDETYGRGSDRATIDVVVLVGKADERSAFDKIGEYADGSGATSIKAAVDGGTYVACDSARVASVTFDVVTVGAVDYLAATFQVEVFGPGSS